MFFINGLLATYKATIGTDSDSDSIKGILALAAIGSKGKVKLLYYKGRMYNGWVAIYKETEIYQQIGQSLNILCVE